MQFKGKLKENETNLKLELHKVFIVTCDGTFFVLLCFIYIQIQNCFIIIIVYYVNTSILNSVVAILYIKCIDQQLIHILPPLEERLGG